MNNSNLNIPTKRSEEFWDYVVISVACEQQLETARAEIDSRIERGFLDSRSRFICLADDDGKRIGSGGATLNAFRFLREIEGRKNFLDGKRVLLIHSGGDSSRAPLYSVCGKLFANIFRTLPDGSCAVMLDELLEKLSTFLPRFDSGVLVSASDMLVTPTLLAPAEHEKFTDSVGFAIKTDVSFGERHGVFVGKPGGYVERFMHKRPAQELEATHALDTDGRVMLDTGIAYLSPELVYRLSDPSLAQFINERVRMSFYGDFLFPLALHSSLEEYLAQSAETDCFDEISLCRHRLFELLSGLKMRVALLCEQDFLHMGTTAEILGISRNNMYFQSGKWSRVCCSNVSGVGFSALNSFFEIGAQIGEGSFINNCFIGKDVRCGKGCVLSDIDIDDITIPDGVCVSGVKLRDGKFVARVHGVDENLKTVLDGQSLWNRKLFPPRNSGRLALEASLAGNGADGECESLRSSFLKADCAYHAERRDFLRRIVVHAKDFDLLRSRVAQELTVCHGIYRSADNAAESREVKLPLRVNFSGTWTDCAPYCIENGGEVINAAISIDGRLPVRAKVERLPEAKIVFACTDSLRSQSYDSVDALRDFSSPHDEFLLHKSVLLVSGIVPSVGGSMSEVVETLGGGLSLTTDVTGIPRGSGLGTSSILLASCFKALGELLGKLPDEKEIFGLVFGAEQLMKTGGGWQDQVGGAVRGFKLISSLPGEKQSIGFRQIEIPDKLKKDLTERYCMLYVGERKFGRYIVRDIMSRYIERRPDTLEALAALRALNADTLKSLEHGNIDDFAKALDQHNLLLSRLSSMIVTAKTNEIIRRCGSLIAGKSVCGAGGGGFLQVVLADGASVQELKNVLKGGFGSAEPQIFESEFVY